MDAPPDRALILLVRRGETNAYGSLVERYQQSVFGVCYHILQNREDAEDLAQDSFIRAFQRLDQYDLDREFGPWIRRLAANLSINELKRRKQLFPLDEELDAPPLATALTPEGALDQRERAVRIQQALGGLPPIQRAAIELRHFQNMDYQEIADTLGIPLNTARSHLFRARKILATVLRD